MVFTGCSILKFSGLNKLFILAPNWFHGVPIKLNYKKQTLVSRHTKLKQPAVEKVSMNLSEKKKFSAFFSFTRKMKIPSKNKVLSILMIFHDGHLNHKTNPFDKSGSIVNTFHIT